MIRHLPIALGTPPSRGVRRSQRLAHGLLLALLVCTAPLAAQVQLQYQVKDHAPFVGASLYQPVIGDFDGDGDREAFGSFGFLIDNYLGRFAATPWTFPNVRYVLGAYDFDGDGRDDLLISDGQTPLAREIGIAMNRLPLAFATSQFQYSSLATGFVRAHGVADWDGDGDLDIVIGISTNRTMVQLANDGNGNFTDVTAARMPAVVNAWSVDAADIDGDGDLDMIVDDHLNNPNNLAVMENLGGGVFGAASQARFPAGGRRAFAVGDLDGDGDPDAVTLDGVFENVQGTFAPFAVAPFSIVANPLAAAIGDLDGDGDMDVWFETSNDRPLWYENLGPGVAFAAQRASIPPLRRRADVLELTDVDGDRLLDVLVLTNRVEILAGQPGGTFVDLTPQRAVERFYADLDGDGFTDGVLVSGGFNLQVVRGDGAGGARSLLALSGWGASDIHDGADVDGDGDIDLLVRGPWPSNSGTLVFNNGNGTFQPAPRVVATSVESIQWTLFEDLDGDADLDLIVHFAPSNRPPGTLVLRNDGTGQFAAVPSWQIPNSGVQGFRAVILDADGDGDVDIIAGQSTPILHLNDGSGNLTVAPAAIPVRTAPAVNTLSTADMDGDGDTDLLVFYGGTGSSDDAAVFENAGNGTFTVRNVFAETSDWFRCDWQDLDANGAVDLIVNATEVIGGRRVYTTRFFEDDGAGGWALTTRSVDDVDGPLYGRYLDVDDDGDLDLVGQEILVNTQQQLRSRFVPKLGGTLELEVANTSLNFSTGGWVLVSPQKLAQPFPLPGIGGVIPDPAVGVVLRSASGFRGAPLQVSLPIPNAPALLGTKVYSQGLIQFPGPLRLTNAITDTLAR